MKYKVFAQRNGKDIIIRQDDDDYKNENSRGWYGDIWVEGDYNCTFELYQVALILSWMSIQYTHPFLNVRLEAHG